MKSVKLISAGWNFLFAIGAAVLVYGLWMAWHPLGPIAGGLLLGVIAYGGAIDHVKKAGHR